MINLNDMPEGFYNFIFGDVIVEEFLLNSWSNNHR